MKKNAVPISTRRKEDGIVHEMADRGDGTLCGKDLAEPWQWSDEPISCPVCLAEEARRAEEGGE